ncbi:unnamed protein product [Fraxinus pennsylvanica]|uniref:Growth-regulating factor n=1 Tax=Fraxinus pennsylvanica TaxID=56036 RepID=A0AAD1ZCB5_9LAMI|nr:unnamed protein product [Fraxinus pennsylvanica]
MHGYFARFQGPFTPSQWMELDHQALIYKYILAHVAIPSNLIMPLLRSLYPYATSGSYASNVYQAARIPSIGGVGGLMERNGSARKMLFLVRSTVKGTSIEVATVQEGLKGHAVSGSRSCLSNNLGSTLKQLNPYDSYTAALASTTYPVNRDKNLYGKTHEYQSLMSKPTTINLKPKDVSFSFQKQHAPFEELSHLEFGINSDSPVNPSMKFSYANTRNPISFLGLELNDQNLVSHFNDPTDQSDHTSVSWAKELKSDWTQLSISIPVAPSDFSPSTNSPPQMKPTFLP